MAAPCCRETSSDWIGETETGSNGPSSGFMRFPRTSPGDSLQAPLQFPCSSPAGFRQVSCGAPAGSLQIPCRPPRGFPAVGLLGPCRLAVSLRIPCRSPDPCRSLAGISQIYSDPSSGFPRFPRTSPGDSLQVPLRFPCTSPSGFLRFSCRAFVPPQPLAVHPAMKCIPCAAAAGRAFCVVLEPRATLFLSFWTPEATFPEQW